MFQLQVSVTHPTIQATPGDKAQRGYGYTATQRRDCNHWHHGHVRLRGVCKGPAITRVCDDVALSGYGNGFTRLVLASAVCGDCNLCLGQPSAMLQKQVLVCS